MLLKQDPCTCQCQMSFDSVLLWLSDKIALNPGPINFSFVNSRSIRNKCPLIGHTIVSNNLDILAIAETHFEIFDTDTT